MLIKGKGRRELEVTAFAVVEGGEVRSNLQVLVKFLLQRSLNVAVDTIICQRRVNDRHQVKL